MVVSPILMIAPTGVASTIFLPKVAVIMMLIAVAVLIIIFRALAFLLCLPART